jgi:hypothetical protein
MTTESALVVADAVMNAPANEDAGLRCANPIYAARHVDYIHYNPVKHGFAVSPIDWPYSSYVTMSRRVFTRLLGVATFSI